MLNDRVYTSYISNLKFVFYIFLYLYKLRFILQHLTCANRQLHTSESFSVMGFHADRFKPPRGANNKYYLETLSATPYCGKFGLLKMLGYRPSKIFYNCIQMHSCLAMMSYFNSCVNALMFGYDKIFYSCVKELVYSYDEICLHSCLAIMKFLTVL